MAKAASASQAFAPSEPDVRAAEAAAELAKRELEDLEAKADQADTTAKLEQANAPAAPEVPPPAPEPTAAEIEAAIRDVTAISQAVDCGFALLFARGRSAEDIRTLLDECADDAKDDGRRLGPRVASSRVALPITAAVASKLRRVFEWALKRSAREVTS